MKNKVITILCIMAIVITTAVVAADEDRVAYKIDSTSSDGVVVDQQIKKSDGSLVGNGDVIYPVVGEKNALDRITTVTNNSATVNDTAPSVFVRTVFAFEAADLDINKFHEIMYIKLNQDVYTDDRTVCWDYPADTKWIEMTDGGKRYYMLVATYCKPLSANMTTSPSLLKVGFESSATNESLKVFGDTYEMMAKTQAISVSSYAEGTAPNYALNDAFGKITSTNHPWKGISN